MPLYLFFLCEHYFTCIHIHHDPAPCTQKRCGIVEIKVFHHAFQILTVAAVVEWVLNILITLLENCEVVVQVELSPMLIHIILLKIVIVALEIIIVEVIIAEVVIIAIVIVIKVMIAIDVISVRWRPFLHLVGQLALLLLLVYLLLPTFEFLQHFLSLVLRLQKYDFLVLLGFRLLRLLLLRCINLAGALGDIGLRYM